MRIVELNELNIRTAPVPSSASSLKLSGVRFNTFNDDELDLFLSKLHPHITRVDVFFSTLFQIPSTKLCAFFIALANVNEFYFNSTKLDDITIHDLMTLFSYLKPIQLSLDYMELHKKSAIELSSLIGHLPQRIQTFSLKGNKLGLMSPETLEQVFSSLSPGIRSLDLGGNKFDEFVIKNTADALVMTISRIPQTVSNMHLSENKLGLLKPADLTKIVSFLSRNIRELDLSNNILGHHPQENLVNAIGAGLKHHHVSSLNLSANNLGGLPIEHWVTFLKAFPRSIRSLNIGFNRLEALHIHDLCTLVRSIPSGIQTLNVSGSRLLNRLPDELHALFNEIKLDTLILAVNQLSTCDNELLIDSFQSLTGIRALDLSQNLLHQLPLNLLVKLVRDLPMNIKSLNLSSNHLGSTQAEVISVFRNISNHISTLDLSDNDFDQLSNNILAEAISQLPLSIHYLNLSRNQLGFMPPETIRILLSRLREGLTHLDLSHNQLNQVPADAWLLIFSTLSPDVNVLKLSHNGLGLMPPDALKDLLSSMPQGVNQLDLSHNQIHLISAHEWPLIWQSLSPHVSFIDLSHNDIGGLDAQQRINLIESIPPHVTTISLGHNQLHLLSQEALIEMLLLFPPHVKNINLTGNQIFTHRAPHEVDAMLVGLRAINANLMLTNNGESDYARGLLALSSLRMSGKLPFTLGSHILSFLSSSSVPEINRQLEELKPFTV